MARLAATRALPLVLVVALGVILGIVVGAVLVLYAVVPNEPAASPSWDPAPGLLSRIESQRREMERTDAAVRSQQERRWERQNSVPPGAYPQRQIEYQRWLGLMDRYQRESNSSSYPHRDSSYGGGSRPSPRYDSLSDLRRRVYSGW